MKLIRHANKKDGVFPLLNIDHFYALQSLAELVCGENAYQPAAKRHTQRGERLAIFLSAS